MPKVSIVRLLIASVLTLVLTGCYYGQAARGQLELLSKREPLGKVIDDPDTPADLAARLELVSAARDFSIEELKLPDNKSYRSYADIERDYVVWNVFAAPEFSLQPETWCFPVAGCVAYRGYFRREAAEREAEKLADRGMDVHVGGVTAYSTLGKFNDPVLSTMLRWDDVQLVSVLFHELAHQQLYVKGDSAFNESFATAIEEYGIERFLERRGEPESMRKYRERKELRRELVSLVDAARRDLEALYAEPLDDADKRRRKEQRLDELSRDIRRLYSDEGRAVNEDWLSRPFNNARIASMVLYEGRVPAFRQLLTDCDEDLACFYAEAEQLADMPPDERDASLAALAATP